MGMADSGQRGTVIKLERQHRHNFTFHAVSGHAIMLYHAMMQTGASSTPLPSRTIRRLPVLEAFSLIAAACAGLTFSPYIVHSGTSVAPVRCVPLLLHYIVATAGFRNPQLSRVLLMFRPQALAADVSELLVWLFTTAALRLYWHSAHLHQLPLSLMLLWCAKAACSVVLAVLQASLTYEHIQLSFQVCHFVTVAVLLIAVLFCTRCWVCNSCSPF